MENVLKAVSESPYELVVENRIIVFGGRDLTGFAYGKNADGSMGEYFTKSTELDSDYTKTGRLYVDFEHGRDPDKIGNDKNTVLGFVDWKTARVDDEGVIVKRVLNRRHEYMKWLEPLIKAGLVGTSSQSVAGQAEKADSGEIKKWPLERDALTVTPMEPRMIEGNVLVAMKALADEFPEYKSLIPPDTALPDKDEPKNNVIPNREKFKMEQEDVKALVAQGVADAMKARDEAEAAKAAEAAKIKAAEDAAYKKAVEDIKAAGPQTFYHSIEPTDDDNDGVGAFKAWMRTGQENNDLIRPDSSFEKIQNGKAAWNVTTGASGGFLVPDPLYNQIVAKRDLASWVRQAPVQKFTTQSDHLLVPREDTKHTAFVLTAEAGTYNEDEGTVSQKDLILYKYTKMEKVNEEFLMYNSTNFESWLASALGRAEAVTENTIFTNGTGSGQPEGAAYASTVTGVAITTSAQLVPADLTSIIGKLGAGYNVPSECGFLLANASKWYLKNAILAGPFAWSTNNGGNGAPDFFGYNSYVSDDMPSYTSTTVTDKVLLFGNFSYYGVVEKPGMIVQRNPYLYMATGQIGIFASIFRGGGVLQAEALYHHVAK